MIRDPSDGSVKEINPAANEINALTAKPASEEITSGLPFASSKPEYIERLERSRAWVRNYNAAHPIEPAQSPAREGAGHE